MARQRKSALDKFYTKPEVAKYLISQINVEDFAEIIEPSAGAGAFSSQIKNCIAFDIEPLGENIQKCDFLKLKYVPKARPVLVIGNPPFGLQSSLATKFINKSAEFADVIAFILPASFRKKSMQNKVNLNFHIIKEIDVPPYAFTVEGKDINLPCIFQVWEKRNVKRKITKKMKPIGFSFVDKSEADISFRRVGGTAGSVSDHIEDKAVVSHYFIKVINGSVNKWLNIFKSIDWKELHLNTIGPRSISKQEIMEKIYDYIMSK